MKRTLKDMLIDEKGQGILLGRTLVWIAMVLTIILVFIGVSYLGKMDDPKIGAPADEYEYYFTQWYVESGTTVSDIYYLVADEYPDTIYWDVNDYAANVQHMNHLDSKCTIKSGTKIIVPYLIKKTEVVE